MTLPARGIRIRRLRLLGAVLVEIETSDGIFTLERPLGGKNVTLYQSSMDTLSEVTSVRRVVDPISDPDSISQWLLATVGLQDVRLQEAPTKGESGTDRLSFRDLMWLCLYYNERGAVLLPPRTGSEPHYEATKTYPSKGDPYTTSAWQRNEKPQAAKIAVSSV